MPMAHGMDDTSLKRACTQCGVLTKFCPLCPDCLGVYMENMTAEDFASALADVCDDLISKKEGK